MANPYSIRQSWIVKSLATAGTGTHQLKPFEFGIINPTTWKAVSAGTFSTINEILFAVGSPHTKTSGNNNAFGFPNNASRNISFKSNKLNGRSITSVRVAKPQKQNQPYQIYLGYDGVNGSKNLKMECGTTYAVQLAVYGSPVGLTFPDGHMTEVIDVTTPCCDDCASGCLTADMNHKVIDELVKKINHAPWVGHYVKAEKIINCEYGTDPDPVTKVSFREWTLSLCDQGDAVALANVVNQYAAQPFKITRKSRTGTTSTYSACIEVSDTENLDADQPTDYSQSDIIIPDCESCPIGYTSTPARHIWIVSTTLSTAVASTANMATLAGWTTAADVVGYTLLSEDHGVRTWQVLIKTDAVAPTPTSPVGVTTFDTGELSAPYCTITSPVTTEWVGGDTFYKVKRTLTLQVPIPDCTTESNDLDDRVEAALADAKDIISGTFALTTTDDCFKIYTVDQLNTECLYDTCGTDVAVAKFVPLPSFEGQMWGLDPMSGWTTDPDTGCPIRDTTGDPDCCQVGIKITGAFIDTHTNDAIWDLVDYVNYDPVRFEAQFLKFDDKGINPPEVCNSSIAPVTKSSFPKSKYLTGDEVLRDIILTGMYRDEPFFSAQERRGLRYRAAEGLQYGVSLDKYYYSINITFEGRGQGQDTNVSGFSRTEIVLYFEEADISVLQQVLAQLNSYVTSTGLNLIPAAL